MKVFNSLSKSDTIFTEYGSWKFFTGIKIFLVASVTKRYGFNITYFKENNIYFSCFDLGQERALISLEITHSCDDYRRVDSFVPVTC